MTDSGTDKRVSLFFFFRIIIRHFAAHIILLFIVYYDKIKGNSYYKRIRR